MLVNFWECHPVGHVVEVLRYCLGHARAVGSGRGSVVLNWRDLSGGIVALHRGTVPR